MAGPVGVEIPGGGQQREAGDTARLARRQCHGERAAHAITHHRRRPARAFGEEGERALEARDIGRGVEPALLVVERSPVDEVGPETLRRHAAQQALLGGEVEHLPAIDQRRHHQHRPCAARAGGAMRGAVVEQPRIAFAPHRRRILQRAMDRVLTIGEHAVGQPMHAPRNLAAERALEFARTVPGFEGGNLGQQGRDGLRHGALRND
jgi:hypothetical protein